MSETVMLSNVRLSFPELVEPKGDKNNPNNKRFRGSFLMPVGGDQWKAVEAAIGNVAKAEWQDKAVGVMQLVNADAKSRCYGQGDQRRNQTTFEVYDGYAGMIYITAYNKEDRPPQIVGTDGKVVPVTNTMLLREVAGQMYPGCYVNVALSIYAQKANQEKGYGPGIRASIVAIQFCKDGERFGEAAANVSGMFGAVAGGQLPPAATDGLPSFMQ